MLRIPAIIFVVAMHLFIGFRQFQIHVFHLESVLHLWKENTRIILWSFTREATGLDVAHSFVFVAVFYLLHFYS